MDWVELADDLLCLEHCCGDENYAEKADRQLRFFCFLLWAVIIIGGLYLLFLCFKPEIGSSAANPVFVRPHTSYVYVSPERAPDSRKTALKATLASHSRHKQKQPLASKTQANSKPASALHGSSGAKSKVKHSRSHSSPAKKKG